MSKPRRRSTPTGSAKILRVSRGSRAKAVRRDLRPAKKGWLPFQGFKFHKWAPVSRVLSENLNCSSERDRWEQLEAHSILARNLVA